jgi:hypothetical protein
MLYEIPNNANILSIKEDTIVDRSCGYKQTYEGLIIETDKGSIKIVISDDQSCCEQWGALFFETPDDISQFIGAEILQIEDINIKRDEFIDNETQLRITTDKGVIQYAIYNDHNGYYSHATILQVFDRIENGCL